MRTIFLGITLFAAAFLMAQDDFPVCCPRGPHPSRIDARHLEYQGLGFDKGYTTLAIFLANGEPWFENNYGFFDLRGHVFNDGKPALNAGFGWRYLLDSRCHAVGLNAYYDYRKTHRKDYNQAGLGLEYLTPCWEFRANGYLPFGAQHSRYFDLEFDHFAGNQFFVKRKHEFAMTGCDAEVGWHFKHWRHFDFFAGIGPYYFKGYLGNAAIGGKARLKARITPYLALEVGDSYDQVFRNRFNAEITLSFPFGPRTKSKHDDACCSCKQQNMLQEWLHDPPNRDEIIVVDTQKKTSVAIDPGTGLPFFLWFVNNTSSSNGTFESPFPNFALAEAAAQPGDVIYVFPGDGTTTGMASGILLKDSQRLLGSGVSHGFNTTVGFMAIPPQSVESPSITNAGIVVTLANHNEVSGFQIMGGTTGVFGAWAGGSISANVNRNNLLNTGGMAIDLNPTSAAANLIVDGNYIFSSLSHAINTPFADSIGTVIVQNNFIDNSNISSLVVMVGRGVQMNHTGTSVVSSIVRNNTIMDTIQDSIYIDAAGMTTFVDSTVQNNTIFLRYGTVAIPSPSTSGINLQTQLASTHISKIFSNRVSGHKGFTSFRGILVESAMGSLPTSRTETIIENNSVRGGLDGIILSTLADGSIQGSILSNQVMFSTHRLDPPPTATAALSISAAGTGTISGEISGNLIFESAGVGLRLTAFATGTIDFVCSHNTIAENEYGIFMESFGGTNRTRFLSNQIRNSGQGGDVTPGFGPGVFISPDNGGSCQAEFISNTFSENLLYDLQVFIGGNAPLGASACIKLQDNSVDKGFSFDNAFNPGGTIFLEHPNYNGIGPIFINGDVIYVPAGTCF